MSFFGKIRDDIKSIIAKVEGSFPQVEAEVKRETISIVQRLVDYVEARLPEIEQAAVAVAERAIPAAAPAIGAAGTIAEQAAAMGLKIIEQKVATPTMPLPGTGTHAGCTAEAPCVAHGGQPAPAVAQKTDAEQPK